MPTTFAVNLAWELCNVAEKGKPDPRVCILDLDLQYGSVSTFLATCPVARPCSNV